MKTKKPTSIRISDEAKRLLRKLSDDLQISQAAMLEILIREKAEQRGIK